ncbi:MAG: PAS domain S-box protein [Cytophagaceae bacterium]|nr:PAS domain S-box protein [Cytophagaceae bacterium]
MEYKYLQKYAAFLLQNDLSDFVRQHLQRAHEINLPMLSLFKNYSKEELFELAKKSVIAFLNSIVNNTALEEVKKSTELWKKGQMPDIGKSDIVISDIILTHHLRKESLIKFLEAYTKDLSLYRDIVLEVEEFYTKAYEITFGTFIEVQKDLFTREKELTETVFNYSLHSIVALRAIRDENKKVIDFEYILINRTAEQMLGKSKSQIIGKKLLSEYPAIKRQGIYDSYVEAVENGKDFDREFLYETEGFKHWFRQAGTKWLDGLVVTTVDITPLKKTEAELEEKVRERTAALEYQSRLNKIITDNTTSCLFLMNSRGFCTFMNPAGEKMFGYTFEEISQKPLHYMVHHHRPDGSSYPMEECPIDKVLKENHNITELEDVFIKKDGTYFPVSCSVSPIYENGIPIAVVIEVRDITEEKQSEREIYQKNIDLSQKNKELIKINNDLDNFIYTASHDLKAPVSNIEGLMDTLTTSLKEKNKIDEDIEQIIDVITASVKRFQGTIRDLTEVSKTQKNINEDISIINVSEVIEDVKMSIDNLIKQSGAEIKTHIDSSSIINFSKINFTSIIYNLVSNAIKYRSPERKPLIEILWTKKKDNFILEVKDNGLGIKEEHKDKIFQMFKRLHDHVEGSGVGLYIVKRIIDNTGGKIEVETSEGVGTTFKICFPKTLVAAGSFNNNNKIKFS